MLRGATGPVVMGLGTLFTGAAALAIGMPVHWVLAFCAVASGIAFLVPPAVRRSVASLDRDLQRHRQRNEIHALLPAYRRARLARALGPRTAMRMRLAESLLDSGEAVRARDLLEKTTARAADGDMPRYLPLLVRARFLAGDDAGTLKAFAALRRHGFPLPGHVHAAAWAMLRTGRPPAEAESLAETALAGPTPAEAAAAALVRAEIALARGLPDAVMVHLDACDESRLPREARPAATLARGQALLALGRRQEAVAVLRGVEEIGKGTRFAAEAADAIGAAGSPDSLP
ncbi:MAG: hypothetical protein QME96_13785 [Myxococcota bacterium]|nr:hypothetical protein [Myxococcota bacterium]